MKSLLGVLLGLSLISDVYAQVPPPMPPSISISGEAKESVAPDQATITASVVSRDKDLAAAKKNNDAQMEKVVQIAKEFNIPKNRITPSHMSINPEYNYNNNQRPALIGYMVSRTLMITMDKLDIHERVLSALVEAKIDQVSGVNFSVTNPEKISERLRVAALNDAKAKASALASAAGMKLGKPISISVGGGGGYRPPMPMMARAMMADSSEKASVAPSLPGMIEMQETVSVTYALE